MAEKRRLADERAKADEIAKRKEEERAREAKLAAEAEERQRVEAEQRTARMEEQAHIVTTLANGLSDLAVGNLTCEIETDFPEAYEALRLDFNAAILNLSQIVAQLKESSEVIEGNCSEISSASEDLATRTENNASHWQRPLLMLVTYLQAWPRPPRTLVRQQPQSKACGRRQN